MVSSMQKQSIDYSLIACAHHESGHIIVALLNLIQVSDAKIQIDGDDSTGLTQFYMYKNTDVGDRELLEILVLSDLQVAYSGLASERIYYKDICGSNRFPLHLRIGSSEDFSSAQKLIRINKLASPGKETSDLKKKLQSEIEKMLTIYWNDVKIIAHALYQRRKLYYVDLKNLLCKKQNPNSDFWKQQFKMINYIHSDNKMPEEQEVKRILIDNLQK